MRDLRGVRGVRGARGAKGVRGASVVGKWGEPNFWGLHCGLQ